MYEAHYDMMCAYVTLRGLIDYYIRSGSGFFALSVCDVNGRERQHTTGLVNVPVKFYVDEVE